MKTKFCLILISAWLAMTLTIDFMVLPKVFAVVKDVFMGGRIGSSLFTAFNFCELGLAALILSFTISLPFSKKWHKLAALISALGLLVISCLYQFYLTPAIINATNTLAGIPLTEVDARAQVFLNHQFYHQWYIRVDSLKILLLIFLMILLILNNEKINKDQV